MSMTVKKIIESLQKLDPKLGCMSASDGEGNNYSEVGFTPSVMWVRTDSHVKNLEVIADEDYEDLDASDKKLYKKMVCLN